MLFRGGRREAEEWPGTDDPGEGDCFIADPGVPELWSDMEPGVPTTCSVWVRAPGCSISVAMTGEHWTRLCVKYYAVELMEIACRRTSVERRFVVASREKSAVGYPDVVVAAS